MSSSCLLRKIFSGVEQSKLVMIEGHLPSAPSLPIWLALLASRKQSHPCTVLSSIPSIPLSSVLQDCICVEVNSAEQLLSRIDNLSVDHPTGPPGFVFIDDLDLMLFHYPVSLVVTQLVRLCESKHVLGVTILFNLDAHGEEIRAALYYYATSLISVKSVSVPNGLSSPCLRFSITLLHRKKSGKVTRDLLIVDLLERDFSLISTASVDNNAISPVVNNSESGETGSSGGDPIAGLTTFSLTLSERERESRSQLKLPYTKSEQAKASELSGGRIVYEPDEYDDIDEEDPDDDLDI